jgi:KUP system potassium uptake protein
MVAVGLVGATLLYGDGTITPAISVLSAIEGLKIYAPQMESVVVPLTVAILLVLFLIQRNGTSWIGGLFGPSTLPQRGGLGSGSALPRGDRRHVAARLG